MLLLEKIYRDYPFPIFCGGLGGIRGVHKGPGNSSAASDRETVFLELFGEHCRTQGSALGLVFSGLPTPGRIVPQCFPILEMVRGLVGSKEPDSFSIFRKLSVSFSNRQILFLSTISGDKSCYRRLIRVINLRNNEFKIMI